MLKKGDLVSFTTRGAWIYADAEVRYKYRNPGLILNKIPKAWNSTKHSYTILWANSETTNEHESFLEKENEHDSD